MSQEHSDEEKNVHFEAGVPIFSPPPQSQEAEQRAERKATRTYEDRQISIQRQILRTQIGLVVFGLIGGAISYRQANISQKAAETSDKSVLLAQKTERDSRKSSEDQARQSAAALQATIDNFRNDQRPYLAESKGSISSPFIRPQDGASDGKVQIVWNWSMTNYGKSPAGDVRFVEEMKLPNRTFVKNYKNTKAVSIGESMAPTIDVFDSIFSAPMTSHEAQSALQANEGISIRITIKYRDMGNHAYETRLCLTHPIIGSPGYCNKDNYIH